jgi:hypothetical protein
MRRVAAFTASVVLAATLSACGVYIGTVPPPAPSAATVASPAALAPSGASGAASGAASGEPGCTRPSTDVAWVNQCLPFFFPQSFILSMRQAEGRAGASDWLGRAWQLIAARLGVAGPPSGWGTAALLLFRAAVTVAFPMISCDDLPTAPPRTNGPVVVTQGNLTALAFICRGDAGTGA